MSMLALGLLFGAVTLIVMFSGMPIAFALGVVSIGFMYFFMPASSLDTVTQNVYEEMASITLLSIPLFILKGAAIGKSNAGRDLYAVMHAWMQRIPGGLGIANATCALFAAMAGSADDLLRDQRRHRKCASAATRPAHVRDHRRRWHLGILLPPSITMILYAVAAEQSLAACSSPGSAGPAAGRAVRGVRVVPFPPGIQGGAGGVRRASRRSAYLEDVTYTLRQRSDAARVLPFVILLIGVMVALYGGFAAVETMAWARCSHWR
jgi:hypothetical protein